MRMNDALSRAPATEDGGDVSTAADDWADRSRRVLTRDLLVRATHAQPGERRALQFRALHLNLPVVNEVADRLGLTDPERLELEHPALDGLHEAVQRYDPYGDPDFPEFAATFIEEQLRSHLAGTAPRSGSTRTVGRPDDLGRRTTTEGALFRVVDDLRP